MKKFCILVLVASLAFTGCATIKAKLVPPKVQAAIETAKTALIEINKVATPENARKALTVAEEVRHYLANRVADAYTHQLMTDSTYKRLRFYDNEFRATWAKAAAAVDRWDAAPTDPNGRAGFLAQYQQLVSIVDLVKAIFAEVKP